MSNDDATIPPDLILITYIRATPHTVWNALTQTEFTSQYFFGRSIESDWTQGASWRLIMPDGRTDVAGEVLESTPEKRLKLSWRVDWLEETRNLAPAIVTYDLEAVGDVTKLTLTQHNDGPAPKKFIESGKQGWALILSSLKSLLETGKPIKVEMKPPQ